MRILNIGCGIKTSDSADVTNIDWSMYLRIKKNPFFSLLSGLVLGKDRYARLKALPDSIIVHDLRKGIPFGDNSVDAVYHSHFLEHLDRESAPLFLTEVKRVLKPGGIHRIVVPDLEDLSKKYLAHAELCRKDAANIPAHENYIAEMIEQMVRGEAYGTSQQKPFRRRLENLFLGDARNRGETHQWMYDEINLSHMLAGLGYKNITRKSHDSSQIFGWAATALDLDEAGGEYKPGSLYIEAGK